MTALLLTLTLLSAAPATGPTFIEDDYPRALATAKKEKKLLFVDAWAPWCHSCIFMKEHVLNTPAFVPFEKQVVFAAVDTEKAKSASFLEKFPVDVWPTYFFVDPSTEKLVLKWIGSADATQMQALITAAQHPTGSRLAEADALLAEGKAADAADRYLAALKGEKNANARAVLSLLSALATSRKNEVCARTADEQAPQLTVAGDRINALIWGLGCALELDPKSPERAKLLPSLVAQGKAALKLEGAFADDVSGLYEQLVEERKAAKDVAGAEALAKDWLAFLEAAAGKAKTPAARAVFDPHRLSAALEMHRPELAEAPLIRSEREFPADYNPPARLAVVYRELNRYDDALAAIDRALTKCTEGPRKLRLYETKASIQHKKGDVVGRRKTVEEELAWAKKLPRSQISEKRVAAIEEFLKTVPQK